MQELSSIDMMESSVIGQIIVDGRLIIHALEQGLSPSDFYDKRKSLVYSAMITMHSKSIDIDIASLKVCLDEMNINNSVNELTRYTVMAVGDFVSNIKWIKSMALKRNMKRRVSEVLSKIEKNDVQKTVDDLSNVIEEISSNGCTVEDMVEQISDVKRVEMRKAIDSGIYALNDLLGGGFRMGSLAVLTGDPGSGKSTLVNQFMAMSIKSEHKAFIYSGELTNFNVLQWLMRTVANVDDLKQYMNAAGSYYDIKSDGEYAIREWLKGKLFIFNENTKPSLANIALSIEYLARKGVELFVVDNLMTIEDEAIEELERQKNVARRLKSIAKKHNVAVILIAHPKKRDSKQRQQHMFDVAGASEVVNLADYVLMLTRDISDNEDHIDVTRLTVLKNRVTGKQRAIIELKFDDVRKRFYMKTSERDIDYCYSNVVSKNQMYIEVECDEVPF